MQEEKSLNEITYNQKSRRYQTYDLTAPISKRQHKKREELDLSQCEITSHNTGSVSSSDTKLLKTNDNNFKKT